MKEFGVSDERIKFVKVKNKDAEDWISNNEWYWINVEKANYIVRIKIAKTIKAPVFT